MMRSYIIAVFALCAGVLGCELLDPNPGPSPLKSGEGSGVVDTNTEVSLAVGEEKYRENCERCHGAQAEGTSIYEFSIAGFTNTTNVVRNGLRSMPAFPHLTDQTIESMELFLAEQIIPNLVTGQDFYVFYCQRCHGADARGTDLAGGIRNEGFGSTRAAVRAGPSTMPSYTAEQISDDQIQLIVDYIASL